MKKRTSRAEARQHLLQLVQDEAKMRMNRQITMFLPVASDSEQDRQKKVDRTVAQLHVWADDTVSFLQDNAWAPDPLGRFGSRQIPEGLAPRGMVPLLMFPKMKELARTWDAALDAADKDEGFDVMLDKTRQGAVTTEFCWWAVHKLLFRKSTTGLFCSYSPDEIDSGGKGQRDATSLFGRLRMFLDAFFWNFSVLLPSGHRHTFLKFNQHKAPTGTPNRNTQFRFTAWQRNFLGMDDGDDISMKLVRPRWFVGGVEMFAGAEGNWIRGERPGDSFGRQYTATYAFFDEFAHYNENCGAETDKATWAASTQNTACRFAVWTWPRGNARSTHAYRLMHGDKLDGSVVKSLHFDWPDLPVYLFGAHWECRCGHANGVSHRDPPPPEGYVKTCEVCTRQTKVDRFNLTSPWLRRSLAKMKGDKVGIAAEIMRDPAGTLEDRLFSGWHEATGIIARRQRKRTILLEGFDPGMNVANPAAWICSEFDLDAKTHHIVGYWMAAETFIEWWVPFFKRWDRKALRRMRPIYGKRADTESWLEAFHYDETALKMMDRMSQRVRGDLVFPLGLVGGDKYGSHQHMMESAYDRLRDYGIHVDQEYTGDRESLVRTGAEWASRMTVEEEIADVMPQRPLGGVYPSLREIFSGAQPRPYSGQGDYKFDVDKQEPPNVVHAVDAWLYLVRLLTNDLHAVASRTGEFGLEDARAGEPFYWA